MLDCNKLNDALLKKAKNFKNQECRKWKSSDFVHSYADAAPTRLHVLEGTPPRGFIIEVGVVRGLARFHRFDAGGELLKTFLHDI